jgi:hypothetical protein
MILEHALLPVRPEQADDFEAAFFEAKPTVVQHFVTVVGDAAPGTPPAVTAITPNQQ